MADVQAFQGWRYDPSQVGSLGDVTAPPYDVIGSAAQDELYESHPCNVVRLILNRDEPGDEPEQRYTRAAKFLAEWQRDGVLTQEREDALYVYHQEFDWDGVHYVRKGFIGRLRLEEFGDGQVYPHEQTMAGPKADRLALTKACQLNLSPIFSVYPDPDTAAQKPLEAAIRGQTALEVTDEQGVLHRFWPVTDHAVISQVVEAIRGKAVFIADGHHRYETACNYRNYLKEQGELTDDSHPANFVLMMFVGMSDAGLAILPTHRLISGLPDLTSEELVAALGDGFEVEVIGEGAAGATEAWERMEIDGGQNVFGFGTAADGKWVFARLLDASPMAELAAEQSEEWRALGVSILHRYIIDQLLGKQLEDADPSCRYVRKVDELNASLPEKTCQVACIVAPAGIEHIEQIAATCEKMPAKSTYFYPKLLSGLVFNPLA
jgi:uncharacterized protein (DUF1015 family)